MAAITGQVSTARGGTVRGRMPYLVDVSIDLAQAATDKGSAVVATDTIQAITVPANTAILAAGIETTTAPAGGSSFSVDLGVTGGDVDTFVDGYAVTGSAAGAYASIPATGSGMAYVGSAADTLDLLCIGTTVDTSGVLRVWAILMDIDSIGDVAADEVARDALA